MRTINQINLWAQRLPSPTMEMIRVIFGIFLLFQGLRHMQDIEGLVFQVDPEDYQGNLFFLARYVVFVQIGGGLMIILGLLTKTAILLQLPIIVVTLLLNATGIIQSNLFLLIGALILSGLFLIYGSGKFSVDRYKNELHTHQV